MVESDDPVVAVAVAKVTPVVADPVGSAMAVVVASMTLTESLYWINRL